MFGGVNFGGVYDDTWSWDGKTWTRETLRRSPSARSSYVMSTLAHRVVVFGGGPGYLNDTWVLRKNSWRELETSANPAGRTGSALEYDAARREAVLFGGYIVDGSGAHAVDDTWSLHR